LLFDDFPRLKKALREKHFSPTQVGFGVRDDLGLALWSDDFDLHTCSLSDRSDIYLKKLGDFSIVT
jgi:hypothetical protein